MAAIDFDDARRIVRHYLAFNPPAMAGTLYVAPYGREDATHYMPTYGSREFFVDGLEAYARLDNLVLFVDKKTGEVTQALQGDADEKISGMVRIRSAGDDELPALTEEELNHPAPPAPDLFPREALPDLPSDPELAAEVSRIRAKLSTPPRPVDWPNPPVPPSTPLPPPPPPLPPSPPTLPAPDTMAERARKLIEELRTVPSWWGVSFRGFTHRSEFGTVARSAVARGLVPASRNLRIATENFASPGVYAIVGPDGRAIENISKFKNEQEILFLPGTFFQYAGDFEIDGYPIRLVNQTAVNPADRTPVDWDNIRARVATLMEYERSDGIGPYRITTPNKFIGDID